MQGLAGFLDTRVVTESTLWAMPECSIGLFPDVGFASMASRCMPIELALFLALTGTRLSTPADLLFSGVGTHYIPSSQVAELKQSLECTHFSQSLEKAQSQVVGALVRNDMQHGLSHGECHMMIYAQFSYSVPCRPFETLRC